MKNIFLIGCMLFHFTLVFAQKPSKIVIENSDFVDINEIELPDATLLTGNVRVSHDGIVLTCNKAYYFKTENYIKTFGNVQMVQGDTLYLNSKYAEYNGNMKKAFATGEVFMQSPESNLSTDTIYFDRNLQEVFFNNFGTIINRNNTLKSKVGRYYVKDKKYQFLTSVVLTNPEYVIKSNHLDYFTTQGDSYLLGPSTITGKENNIYTENGYYNSKKNIGNFKRKSYIKYKDRLIEGDSLYYDRKREFASGTHNVKITDSINKAIIKGHYGEVYKNKDSLFITKHASVRYLIEKDSMFIHAKKIIVTGKVGDRKITGFNNVRFYKTDLSGKCDSIYSNQKDALTKLIGKPILWNLDNQMTGDLMHLVGNNTTEKIDSLKILNNTFIISKDTIGNGYNQIKGVNLYGKFEGNKLKEADVIKNTEVIYFMRNEKNELIGINKNVSSRINMVLDKESKIETITFFKTVDGEIYPEEDLPENARKLKGFVWRGDERIKNKEDIFPPEEVELDRVIVEESNKNFEKEKISQEIEKNRIEDRLNGDDFYEEIFRKYNNRIVKDTKGGFYLVKNFKFRMPANMNSVGIYLKNHPKYNKEVEIKNFKWDSKSVQGKKYDAGFFIGDEYSEEIEFPFKKGLTHIEIIELYNNRLIIDRNGTDILIRNGKFCFPKDGNSLDKLKKKYPKYKKQIRIDKVLWNWDDQELLKKYNGGFFSGEEQE